MSSGHEFVQAFALHEVLATEAPFDSDGRFNLHRIFYCKYASCEDDDEK